MNWYKLHAKFAEAALTGLLANPNLPWHRDAEWTEAVAEDAWKAADAMMAARDANYAEHLAALEDDDNE
jgi:hypothetical protein